MSTEGMALTALAAAAILAGCATPVPWRITPGEYRHSVSKEITRKAGYTFLLFVPSEGRKAGTRWPLLIFLHGSGERGDQLDQVKVHGPLAYAGKNNFPFLVAAPQAPHETRWSEDGLKVMLDEIIARAPVDTDRVYVTGLSMGGEGTWNFACEYPELIAAIVPVCGRTDPSRAHRLRDVPVRAFHGEKDPIVPVFWSRAMVDAVKAAGGDATLTVDPDAGHDSWTAAYNDPAVYEWLLRQKKRRGGP